MKILIADDHVLVLEAVQMKLRSLAATVDFICVSDAAGLAAADCAALDLAVVDLGMPGTVGCGHILALRGRCPILPIIVLSACEDAAIVRRLLDAGVRGFISKTDSSDIMLAAVQLVLSGGIYVPPLVLWSDQVPGAAPGGAGLPDLTQRQIDVLRLLVRGHSNKVIARQLDIGEGTVKVHVAAIFRALGARNRTEAVASARHLIPALD